MSDNEFGYSDLRQIWSDAAEDERPQREAWAHPSMKEVARLVAEMKSDGWREAIYCPKDGTMFVAWEPGCSLPFACNYQGDWPTGSWTAYCDGDAWPARPVLFKPNPKESK